jgi:hypothetical protein
MKLIFRPRSSVCLYLPICLSLSVYTSDWFFSLSVCLCPSIPPTGSVPCLSGSVCLYFRVVLFLVCLSVCLSVSVCLYFRLVLFLVCLSVSVSLYFRLVLFLVCLSLSVYTSDWSCSLQYGTNTMKCGTGA